MFVEVIVCIKAFWWEKQIEASGHLIAALSMEKVKYCSSCPVLGNSLYQLLIAHVKSVRINGFLLPKEQEDVRDSILIGPTVNMMLPSFSQ